LITRPMQLAVMDPANWDGKLVADSVSKGTRLGKREVVRIRGHSATHEARLPSHELPVLLIAQANCFSQSTSCCRGFLAGICGQRGGRYHAFVGAGVKRLVRGHAMHDVGELLVKYRLYHW